MRGKKHKKSNKILVATIRSWDRERPDDGVKYETVFVKNLAKLPNHVECHVDWEEICSVLVARNKYGNCPIL